MTVKNFLKFEVFVSIRYLSEAFLSVQFFQTLFIFCDLAYFSYFGTLSIIIITGGGDYNTDILGLYNTYILTAITPKTLKFIITYSGHSVNMK